MMDATPAIGEKDRLLTLHKYAILDTAPEAAFDDIALLASRTCGTPIATVSLLDADRQWFKARVGFGAPQVPRDVSFCAHAILCKGILEVPDATLDARFRDSPLVTGDPHVRFYAGAPLVAPDGHALGTLCVADRLPRTLTGEQREALEHLSRVAVTQMELRRLEADRDQARAEQSCLADALRERDRQFRTVTDNVPFLIARVDTDLRYLFANRACRHVLSLPPDRVIGRTMPDVLGEAAFAALRPYAERALAGESVEFQMTVPYRVAGPRCMHISYAPELGPDGAVTGFAISALDMTERRRAEEAVSETQRTLVTLMGNVPGTVYRCRNDRNWAMHFVSEGCAALTGYRPQDFTGAGVVTYGGLIDPAHRDKVWDQVQEALREKRPYRIVYPITTRAGDRKWVWEQGSGCFCADGSIRYLEGFLMDVTEGRQAEEALRGRTELLSRVLAAIPHQIFWKDRDSVYLGCNPYFAQVAGLAAPAEIVGLSDRDLPWTPEEAAAYRRDDLRVMESGQDIIDREETNTHNDGTVEVGLTSKIPLHDAEGEIIGVLGVSRNISERKALEAERERLLSELGLLLAEAEARSDRDPLTGLLNHRAFQKRLEEETDRAARAGTPLAVAMMDLDNFKFFNDAYGHLAGDDVLRRVADGLRAGCRSYDTLARFGGDEFALLMPGLQRADADALVRRIITGLDDQGYLPPGHDTPVPFSLSAGVAAFPDEAPSRLEVLDLADTRLRLSKTGAEEAAPALRVRMAMARKVDGFSMLDALVAAVDNKDRYTRRHSEDVLAYSLQIADALGLDERARRTIAVAALLHDVGKIGVPDKVLRKPGRLTEEETAAVRNHPMMGAVIVGAVPGLEDALGAIRHHHERWDGGGYPFGLRGEETPLLARLMAVADAFSAMTTDRPYRKGMARGEALAVLCGGAGTQWDPACVQALLRSAESPEDPGGAAAPVAATDTGHSRRAEAPPTGAIRGGAA